FTNLTTNGDNYLWTFGTGDSTTANQPIFTYPEFGNRDYTVWLFATNNYGCKDSISKNIHIIELPWYYIPNTFTPEGNNRNELFHPVFIPGFTPRNYSFTIFNRWGEVIYQTNDIYGYWDGVYKGVMVPMGTYIWQIKFAENKTDKVYIERGHVNVIH
ncbi:MAG TPA: T9SS type B sorting domain-containing protein, partial [Crocinitomix sp.]|nr:T9SS type B sorting domain-containing protein [Crocinitomix sp.]